MFDGIRYGSTIYDGTSASITLPKDSEKSWHFDICDYGISVSPEAEGVGTPEFAEAFKQAQHFHRQIFDDTMSDTERCEYAIRWRASEYPFKFQWIMGMSDGQGNWLDDDWGYKTLVVWDNKWIRSHESECPIVTHYMDVDWHKREIVKLQATHNQELRKREIEVIKRLSVESPTSILKDVETAVMGHVQRGIQEGVQKAIDAGTASLKQVQAEKQRVASQLKQLEIAEQKVVEREKLKAARQAQPRSLAGYVYILKHIGGTHYKIGRTSNPNDRLRTFSVKLPFAVEYEILISTPDMYKLESELHTRYDSKRVSGEWFNLSDDDLEYLKGLQ